MKVEVPSPSTPCGPFSWELSAVAKAATGPVAYTCIFSRPSHTPESEHMTNLTQELVLNGVSYSRALTTVLWFGENREAVWRQLFAQLQGSRKRKERSESPLRFGGAAGAPHSIVLDASEEVEEVLQAFERGSHLRREQVQRIYRVENAGLRNRFLSLHAQAANSKEAGKLRVRRMFHGTGIDALERITVEGFDIKFADPGGSLGRGIYFAAHSHDSDGYTSKTGVGLEVKGWLPRLPGCKAMLCSKVLSAAHGTICVVTSGGFAYPEHVIFYSGAANDDEDDDDDDSDTEDDSDDSDEDSVDSDDDSDSKDSIANNDGHHHDDDDDDDADDDDDEDADDEL